MNNTYNNLIESIKLIANEKKIPEEFVANALKDAIVKAYTREFQETIVEVIIDLNASRIEVNKLLTVVERYDDLNDYNEIAIEDARKIDPKLGIGDIYKEPINLDTLERPVVAHIFQIFKQNISLESNKQIYLEWSPKIDEVINAEVEKVDEKAGFVIVNLGNTYGFLSNQEKIPGELLVPGQKYNFYIKEVKEQTKGWPIILSRADAGLVKYLINLQVPELQEKIIEIKDIARIAGFKTKISLISHQSGVDPVGTIIGPRGSRIRNVVSQIHGEKIDVVLYSDDLTKYVINACSPADILGIKIAFDEEKQRNNITIVVDENQLPLLIGKRGANVRLLSMLLSANVEIKSQKEAVAENIVYENINSKSYNQRNFEKTAAKYSTNYDILKRLDNDISSLDTINLLSLKNKKEKNKETIKSSNSSESFVENEVKKSEKVSSKPKQSLADLEKLLGDDKPKKQQNTNKVEQTQQPSNSKRKVSSALQDVMNEFDVNEINNEYEESDDSDSIYNDIDEEFDENY